MSHTVQQSSGGTLYFVLITIVNYTNGGEPVAASDITGVFAVDGIIMGNVPASANTLGVPLFPILSGGKIVLFQFVSGAPVEIATKTGLNAVIPCLVHPSVLS